jgi:hypothetical protein
VAVFTPDFQPFFQCFEGELLGLPSVGLEVREGQADSVVGCGTPLVKSRISKSFLFGFERHMSFTLFFFSCGI